MKRITLVACFDEESNQKIENILTNLNVKLCKVPFNIENRLENDTLPYHITLSAWNNDKSKEIISKLKTFNAKKIISDFVFNIMDSTIKGNILFLDLKDEEKIKKLQKSAYDLLPTERYNPLTYQIHSTINIDENKANNIKLLNQLNNIILTLTINKICLFEIYPAKLLYSVELS